MTPPSPPPWSPDPSEGADQYLRTSQIVIGLDGSGRPSVALDGIPLPIDGGWQAAVDAGFAQVADSAERVGEPIAVTVIDTASDWTGRFVVQADRSIAEDVAPPPPVRRRRGPFLALLAAAAVLVVGAAVVVGTQLSSTDQPLASAPPAPQATESAPSPPTRSATQPTLPAPAQPSVQPSALPPAPTAAPNSAAPLPPREAPPATGRPAPRGPEAAHPAPRSGPSPAPSPAPRPAPRAAPRPAPPHSAQPAPGARPAPQPAPSPAPQRPPTAQGVSGRVIDGMGTCLGASATTLASGSCLRTRSEQIWTQTPSGQLTTTGGCLTAVSPQALAVQPCRTGDATQNWRVADRRIVNQGTGDCAVVRPSDRGQPVAATIRCGTGKEPTAQFVKTA